MKLQKCRSRENRRPSANVSALFMNGWHFRTYRNHDWTHQPEMVCASALANTRVSDFRKVIRNTLFQEWFRRISPSNAAASPQSSYRLVSAGQLTFMFSTKTTITFVFYIDGLWISLAVWRDSNCKEDSYEKRHTNTLMTDHLFVIKYLEWWRI